MGNRQSTARQKQISKLFWFKQADNPVFWVTDEQTHLKYVKYRNRVTIDQNRWVDWKRKVVLPINHWATWNSCPCISKWYITSKKPQLLASYLLKRIWQAWNAKSNSTYPNALLGPCRITIVGLPKQMGPGEDICLKLKESAKITVLIERRVTK